MSGGFSPAGADRISITGKDYGDPLKEAEKHWREQGKKHRGDNHHKQWVDACKNNKPNDPGSSFDYSVPFTQAIVAGCAALKDLGKELEWDHEKKRFKGNTVANDFIYFEPRSGYSLKI